MKTIVRLFLTVVMGIAIQDTATSQVVAISGESFRIPELSASLTTEEDEVRVAFAMPVDVRLKQYREVDIEQGDVILYLNGKRIKSIGDFKEKYETLEIGDVVQIGLRRGDDRFISSFDKAHPEDLPQMATRVSVGGGEEGEGPAGISRSFTLGPEAQGAVPVIGLGALLKDSEEGVRVIAKIAVPGGETSGIELKQGDVVSKLNDKEIESVSQLTDLYDQIETGQDVRLEYKRDDKPMSGSFVKQAVRGNVMIRTNEN